MERYIERALAAGFKAYLTKPVNVVEVLKKQLIQKS